MAAQFREAYWRGIREQEARDAEAQRQSIRNASRERSRAVCRTAAELSAEEWARRLWQAFHDSGDQPAKPPLPMAFLPHRALRAQGRAGGRGRPGGTAVIARVVLDDFELLAAAAGVDVKADGKGAFVRLFGR